ncbi:YhbY family RNA-binding protein [Lacticaseibacillus nasuensis]|uniref:CRM domain-containing protein n=1 Tax=Lacticaseibacillus nasuensis JCM 17158 TaxID=1291734 RepID=A0A0R1JKI5_9LACO|nr:YhbY family RNA-binding protein [Lacticaseibacillus nasuensis]KRK71869.1 hypothetical protein FD02_GL002116 [Lacticaseibacillus nasuensis JCM 17158]
MLTGKQKRFLRAQGNTLKPLVILGKNGLTPTLVQSVAAAIEAHELVKINLLPTTEDTPKAVGDYLVEAIGGLQVAQTIGHTVLVYKPAFNPDHRKLSVEVAKL